MKPFSHNISSKQFSFVLKDTVQTNLVNFFLKKMIDQKREFYLEKFYTLFCIFADIMIFWLQTFDYIKAHFHISHILFESSHSVHF